jgi:hypothetical protein
MSSDAMNYQETLQFTQSLRKQLVTEYVKPGMEGLVKDEGSVDRLLKTLKDMDQTALADRKNTIDSSTADSSRDVADAMQKFVHMQMNRNPFERLPDGSVAPASEGATVIPQVNEEKLGEHDLVEGEAEQGVIVESSSDFMARMEVLRAQREADEVRGMT